MAEPTVPTLFSISFTATVNAIARGTLLNPTVIPAALLNEVICKLREQLHDYWSLDMSVTLKRMGYLANITKINLNTFVWNLKDHLELQSLGNFHCFILRNAGMILNPQHSYNLEEVLAVILKPHVGRITELDLSGMGKIERRSEICERINQMNFLRKLSLVDVQLPTVRMLNANSLMRLTYLDITGSRVDDTDGLRFFKNLGTLILHNVRCGWQTMNEISHLERLKVLDISRTNFEEGFDGGVEWLYRHSRQVIEGSIQAAFPNLRFLDLGGLDIIHPERRERFHVIQTICYAHPRLKKIGLVDTPLNYMPASDVGLELGCIFNLHIDNCLEAFLHYSKSCKLQYLEILGEELYRTHHGRQGLEVFRKILKAVVNIVEHNSSIGFWNLSFYTMIDFQFDLLQLPNEDFSDFGKKFLSIIMARAKMACTRWFAISNKIGRVFELYFDKLVASCGAPAFAHALAAQIDAQSSCIFYGDGQTVEDNLSKILYLFVNFFEEARSDVSTCQMAGTAYSLLCNIINYSNIGTDFDSPRRFRVVERILENSNELLHKEFQERGGIDRLAQYFRRRSPEDKDFALKLISLVHLSGTLDVKKIQQQSLLVDLMAYDSVNRNIGKLDLLDRTENLILHIVKSDNYMDSLRFGYSFDDRSILIKHCVDELGSRYGPVVVEAMWILAREAEKNKDEIFQLLEKAGAVDTVLNLCINGRTITGFYNLPVGFDSVAGDLLKQLRLI